MPIPCYETEQSSISATPVWKLKGTPKTLREAIENGLADGGTVQSIEAHVRDYLANCFSAPFFVDHKETVKILTELYTRITRK